MKQSSAPASSALHPALIIIDSQGNLNTTDLDAAGKRYFTIGRRQRDNDIVIPDSIVSGTHGYLLRKENGFFYRDMGSRNGSYVGPVGRESFLHNDESFVEMAEGAVIRIGSLKNADRQVLIMLTYMDADEQICRFAFSGNCARIGRLSDNDIVLKHPSVSRIHCIIEQGSGAGDCVLYDDKSLSGVFINGNRVNGSSPLRDKDIIQILNSRLIYCGRNIYYKKRTRGIAVKCRCIDKWVGKGKGRKQILKDVEADIGGNEFTAVIGGSGAGKSTLMNVMNGSDKKFTGAVFYDNLPLTENFALLKNIVGFVPQQDIIYENLTLRRMLHYTAKMRMPDDTTAGEIDSRITEVLSTLDMTEHQDTYIRKLSGGQKKRASIAVELLADPKLFFLDEPTSGLDPGTEKSLMQTLRRMSRKQDRTIVMVTHTTQNLDLCDRIIFMGPGGRLCFSGSPADAAEFFETDDLTGVYNMVRKNPVMWENKFRSCSHSNAVSEKQEKRNQTDRLKKPHKSLMRQFSIVTRRYLELICRDARRLAVLLMQPLLIGIMLSIVADDDVFDIYESTKSMMFVLSCSAIWIGVFDSIQEICKERNILRREYMAGLKLPVYILSKLLVQMMLCAVQSIFLTSMFLALIKESRDGILFDNFYFEMVFTVWITAVASAAMGLVVSAIVKTGDKAMAAAPFVLIVQLLFSGILFELKGTAKYISYMTVSRWSVEALGSIARLNSLELRLQADFPGLVHEAESLFTDTPQHLMQDWTILLIMAAILSAASLLIIKTVSKDDR